MKNKLIFPLLSVTCLCLTSCGEVIHYASNLDKYVFTMDYHEDFNILQLSDIHWSYNTSTMASKNYLDKLFKEVDSHVKQEQGVNAKIDLVELTGDQFMLANAYHVDSFLAYFEEQAVKYGFKYAIIWGNHDNHGIYNPNWLSGKFANTKYGMYLDLNDDLYGRSNFIINLNEGNSTKWQIANLDSGASFSETALSISRDYDYIRPEQTDWWLKEHALVGEEVPAIAYYHIPQDENAKAWADHLNGANFKTKFFKLENFGDNGTEKYASDFIDVAKNHNLKAAFMGHCHNNDWTFMLDGVVIGLGVKTGEELYYAHINTNSSDIGVKEGLESTGITENFDLIGGSLVTLRYETPSKPAFDLEHLYLNERETSDLVLWVKW